MSIIDARVRLPQDLRPTRYLAPAGQTEQYDKVLGLTSKMNSGTLEGLLSQMAAEGIDRALMHAESEGGESARELNAALSRVIEDHPATFLGVGALDVTDHSPTDIALQVNEAAAQGFVGVTMQPAFLGLDIDARVLYPMYSRAEELGLSVFIHTGVNYSRIHPIRHERAEMLDQVACDFSALNLIACHAGWPWATEFAAVARRHPTVYLEFGALAPKYVAKPGTGWDAIFGMMPNMLMSQVLYGSDWPMMAPQRLLREWRESGLDNPTLQALFHDNAARLFDFKNDGAR